MKRQPVCGMAEAMAWLAGGLAFLAGAVLIVRRWWWV